MAQDTLVCGLQVSVDSTTSGCYVDIAACQLVRSIRQEIEREITSGRHMDDGVKVLDYYVADDGLHYRWQ